MSIDEYIHRFDIYTDLSILVKENVSREAIARLANVLTYNLHFNYVQRIVKGIKRSNKDLNRNIIREIIPML